MPPKKVKQVLESVSINNETEYKEFVKEYIEIDNHLKENADIIKPLKARKNVLQNVIQTYMKQHEISNCQVSDSNFLALINKTTTETVNRNTIASKLKQYVESHNISTNDEKTSEMLSTEITDFIYENLESVDKVDLKRVKIG